MTLIGVGFKVDAKAAVTLEFAKYKSGTAGSNPPTTYSNYSEPDTELYGLFKAAESDWPDITSGTGVVTFPYTVSITDPAGNEYYKTTVKLIAEKTDSGVVYKTIVGTTEKSGRVTSNIVNVDSGLTREVVRAGVTTHGTGTTTKTGTFTIKATAGTREIPDGVTIRNTAAGTVTDGTEQITLGRVLGGVYLANEYTYSIMDEEGHSITDADPLYMFPYEYQTFRMSTTPASPYQYITWTSAESDGDFGTFITGATKTSAKFTMDAVPTPTWIKNRYGILRFNPDITAQKGNTTTNTVTYYLQGYKNGQNDIGIVKFNGSTKTPTWSGTAGVNETGNFYFTIPSTLDAGTYTLTVQMKNDDLIGNGLYTFDVEVINDAGKIVLDTVSVTNTKTISLDKFINSSSTGSASTSVTASLAGTAGSYVNTTNFGSLKKISTISVTGKQVSSNSSGVAGISVSNTGGDSTANVVVYPLPSIGLNSSSGSTSLNSGTTSSSSANSPFTVTIPTGVYHDDIAWSGVSKAKIVFSYDGKSKEAELDFGSSSSGSTSLTKTASADSLTVSDIIDDLVGDSDHYKIQITAYPMNGSTVDTAVSASENVDVYKVSLDGSAGARYYVNGSEKSDHFYAVKGTTYTIKSSAKNSGDRFQNWDDSVFSSESGGSYKVLGARTFKANYNNGSSSSSSSSSSSGRNSGAAGEGMDDYDDVPKTGESKADIWILWSVLFVSILGAGFMIWKRFGLVRAIAEADEEVAVAEHKEEVKAKKKEKEDKIKMLKDLRNL
jgi:LPXTG-motif cell wall-anchored protein